MIKRFIPIMRSLITCQTDATRKYCFNKHPFPFSYFDFKIFRLKRTTMFSARTRSNRGTKYIDAFRRKGIDSISLLIVINPVRINIRVQITYTIVFTINKMIVIRLIKGFRAKHSNLIIERRKMTKRSSVFDACQRITRHGSWFYIFLAIDYSLRKV